MNPNKTITLASLLLVSISFTCCISIYPIQPKSPCDQTTIQEKLDKVESTIKSKKNPKNLHVDQEGVSYRRHEFKFNDVRYVRLKRKLMIFGIYSIYWIQIRENNGDMNEIPLRGKKRIAETNNALMCLTGLWETNGRPKK